MLPKTYVAKQSEIEPKFFLIDAKDQILGRLAVKVARILTGKGKRIYTPHVECGDHVIVINAKKIKVTGNKLKQKTYTHYTGYPGGIYSYNLETLLEKKPTEVISKAVERMLPKNKMAARMMKHLHIYADETHEQKAQKPVTVS